MTSTSSKNDPCPERVLLISRTSHGHRGDYEKFVSSIFEAEVVRRGLRLFERRPVLFLMIEEAPLSFFVSGVLRSLMGRRTAGLLFRVKPVLEGRTCRLKVKRWMLRLQRGFRNTSVLCIVPTYLVPAIEKFVDGWIFDFQLWDRPDWAANARRGALSDRVRRAAGDRKILISLGGQSEAKGILRIAELTPSLLNAGWIPVIAGPVADEVRSAVEQIADAGGVVEGRLLTEDELRQAYNVADLVWCAYHPDYDQASGILGRAVQSGAAVVVREGSLSHHFCVFERAPHIALSWDSDAMELTSALAIFEGWGNVSDSKLVCRFREKSVTVLREALGFASNVG